MSADLYFTRVSFFLSSFFLLFFRRLISEVTEQNSTKIGHMVGSKCNLKTHVRNLGYPPTNRGPKTHLFGRLRNLTATLTGYIFGMKHDIDNRSSALTTTRGLLHDFKMSWTLVHKRLQTRPAFLPTLRKLCILLHCQALQTDISKRNSTTLCQTVERRQQCAVEKLGSSLPKNWGPKDFYICSVFRRLRHLMANICWTKHDTWQSGKGVGKCEGSPTLLQNFMNFGPQTAQNRTGGFTHPHYLCYRVGRPSVAIHR